MKPNKQTTLTTTSTEQSEYKHKEKRSISLKRKSLTNKQNLSKSIHDLKKHNSKHKSSPHMTEQPVKESDLICKLQFKFKKLLEQMNIGLNQNLKLNQYFQLLYKFRKYIKQGQLLLTEQILLSIWKALGGVQSKNLSQDIVFLIILYFQNLLDQATQDHFEHKSKIMKAMSTVQARFKSSKSTLLKKPDNFVQQQIPNNKTTLKQEIKPKRCLKPMFNQPACLEVTIKLKEGVFQKLVIYPHTSVDSLARAFGARYKLSSEKIKMVKQLINSQLKKQLTQITEESVDNLSEISDLFHEIA